MTRQRKPRDWFVAIADVGGEYAGNPPCFDAASVYGPFTAEEAVRLAKVDEEAGGFPDESWTVSLFKVGRLTERQMAKKIRDLVAKSNADRAVEQDELNEEIEYHKGNRGPII